MSEWKEYKLGDLNCKFLSGYAFKSSDYKSDGIPLIKIGNIQNGIIRTSNSVNYVSSDLVNSKTEKFLLKNRDVLIAMTGQGSVGRIGKLYLNDGEMAFLNQRVGKFICDEKNINIDYLYYVLTTPEFQKVLFDSASGSGQPNLSPDIILNTKIPYVNFETQTSIAEILSSLDVKIELNNKINQELETLSQTLFKQWFIDFEFPNENGKPYKSSGGEMVDSELGEIPEGWKAGTFGDIIQKENLKVKKSKSLVTNVYSAVKTSELVLSDEYFTKKVYSKSIENYFVVKNHWFAYNPSRINIGSIGLNKSEIGAVSPVYEVFSTRDYFHFFIEYILQLENTKNAIIQRCSGTVRQALNYIGLSSISLKIPDEELVIIFNDFVENNSEQIRIIANETQELINLRNTLLPKLISGELKINEISN
jgi:type I restriction enzyme S subunit